MGFFHSGVASGCDPRIITTPKFSVSGAGYSFLLLASSNISLSFCIPILLGMMAGLMFCSSLVSLASALELSFKLVFFVLRRFGAGLVSSCCGCCGGGCAFALPLELDDPSC